MIKKRKKNEEGFTLIELIMVIVILGIISAVAVPKFLNLSVSARLSSARGVGSAISGSIMAEHSQYLIDNADTYTLDDVLSGTNFTGGITYNNTDGPPLAGEIREVTDETNIQLNIGGTVFEWDWTARNGDTPALIAEDSSSAFP